MVGGYLPMPSSTLDPDLLAAVRRLRVHPDLAEACRLLADEVARITAAPRVLIVAGAASQPARLLGTAGIDPSVATAALETAPPSSALHRAVSSGMAALAAQGGAAMLFSDSRVELAVPVPVSDGVWGCFLLASVHPGAFPEILRAALGVLAEMTGASLDARPRDAADQPAASLDRPMESWAVLGVLTGSLAHDLNNLLAAISGHASLMAMQFRATGASPSGDASLDAIRNAADRAAKVVRTLQDLGREPRAPEPLPSAAFGSMLTSLLRNELSRRGLRFVHSPNDGAPSILASNPHLLLGFAHLALALAQAAHAPAPGTPITLEWSSSGRAVTASLKLGFPGLPSPVLQWSGPAAVLRRCGLDLLRASGATTPSNQPDGGFVLHLQPAAPPPFSAADPETAPLAGVDIVIADGEEPVRAALAQAITRAGGRVSATTDGLHALELLQRDRYGAVVAGVKLPGIDGPDLYEHTLATDPGFRQRFVFLSRGPESPAAETHLRATGCAVFPSSTPAEEVVHTLARIARRA